MTPPTGSRELLTQYEIKLPPDDGLSQDQEWCDVRVDDEVRRIRFHDYHEIYSVPGLYEQIFYDLLRCDSPRFVCSRLEHALEQAESDPAELTVLDLGAGNGIVAEELRSIGAAAIVGIDLLEEAAEAADRDRPGVYDDYLAADMTALSPADVAELEAREFNCLTTVAALGFGDIPLEVFNSAYELIGDGGWVAFNINEGFTGDRDRSGFSAAIADSLDSGALELWDQSRYRHRLSTRGEPIFYNSIIACKRGPLTVS